MKIRIVLDSDFKGMTSGWPTRYIGLINQLYAEHDLHIYAPGDTSLFNSYFPDAFICTSTSEKPVLPEITLIKYVLSIMSPQQNEIYLPEFCFYPEFKNLLLSDTQEYDLVIYFGLCAYVLYQKCTRSKSEICDICDSSLRHRDTQKRVAAKFKTKIVNAVDKIYIRRVKRKFIGRNLIITAITDLDVAYIKKALKKNNVVTISNGVPSPEFKINETLIDKKILSNEILFCGCLDYTPNVYSVMYILKEIWPILKDSFPELRLKIVGRNPDPIILNAVNAAERVSLFKNVPDVFVHYKTAKLFLSPMFNGGGMKNKMLEAFITGTPVVTNREGITGIEMENGVQGMLGETAEDFVNAVKRILKADKETYAKMAYSCEMLGNKYSWKSSGDRFKTLIESSVKKAEPW